MRINGVLKHCNNERGFSLLEVMTALILTGVILSATIMSFSLWRQLDVELNQPSDQELLLFQKQLSMMFEASHSYWTSAESKLHTTGANEKIVDTYSQHQSVIRRQVNGVGHEVFMQRITHFRVYPHPKGAELHLKLDGAERKWVMYHPSVLTKNNGVVSE